MAMTDKWIIMKMNSSTLLLTEPYTVDGVVQVYTTKAAAVAVITDVFGENEAELFQKDGLTWTVA